MVDASITAPGVLPGAWHRVLLALMVMERLAAWFGLPLHDPPWRIPEPWEITFLEAWGLGLFLVAAPLLILRRRAGGWLAAASAMALATRACIPMLADQPAPGAVVALIVASTTLTFAFLHEQSFWPHA